jgi:hypothetical protein
VVGKGQSVIYPAREIMADDSFINSFAPADIKTITCFAMSDKYEAIFQEKKLSKSHEIIRSKNIDGKKTVLFRNKMTGESVVKYISNFVDEDLIDNLESKDAYQLGYLAGQEQSSRDFARLKILSSKKDECDL